MGARGRVGQGRLPWEGSVSENEKNETNRGLFKGELAAEGG